MSGLEISVPLSLITITQILGFGAKFILDYRYKKATTLSNIHFVGILMFLYNMSRIIRGGQFSTLDLIGFAVLCGFAAALLFQTETKTRIRFFILSIANSVIFLLVLAFSLRIQRISFHNQMFLMAVALNMYFVIYSLISVFRFANKEDQELNPSRIAIGALSVVFSFSTLLFSDETVFGLLTINFIFLAFIGLEYALFFLFNENNANSSSELSTELIDEKQFFENTPSDDSEVKQSLNSSNSDEADSENPIQGELLLENYNLTERQLEIAYLLLTPMTRDQIADKLVISISTVGTHSHEIYKKTGTKHRTEFILKFKDHTSKSQQ